ncbi:MAG: hypothetical protein QW743_06930 [Candidatus Methanomethylicia archaeon]
MKNIDLCDIISLLSSDYNHQIMFFGHGIYYLLDTLLNITSKTLFVFEHSIPLDFPVKDDQYILECLNDFNPYEIFNFKDFINMIVYLPRISNIYFHGLKSYYYKLLIKNFYDKINLMVKVCRFSSLKLILLFKGGSVSFNSRIHVYPRLLEYVSPFFDWVIYFDGNLFTIVKGVNY